jgi:hypothetical protein
MVIFGVAFVPIMCMNAVSEIAALMLLRGADFLPVFNQPQRESLALLFLGVRGYGYDVGWIFGLWLFHFGVCVEVGFPTALARRVADCCMLRLPVRKPYNVSFTELREYREPLSKHPVDVGRTRGYLVASDSGSKGPAIGGWNIK